MSTESEENPVHIGPIDVNYSVNEINTNTEKTSDSGIELVDSSSNTLSVSSVCEISSTNEPEIDSIYEIKKDNGNVHSPDLSPNLTSPSSISPDLNDATENLLSLDEFSSHKIDEIPKESDQTLDAICDLNPIELSIANACNVSVESTRSSNTDLQSNEDGNTKNDGVIPDFNVTNSDLENCNRNLTTSTMSLDEQQCVDTKVSITKSPYSRSAENISTIDQNLSGNLNSSAKDLNTEKILTEFSNQKNKAAATQKLVSDITKTSPENHQNLDTRYARIPKELLSQDLGSIVKNVHGIFSSVSGSLKNAYNHSQRLPKQPPRSIPKPIPNGRLMDDIFEDEADKTHQNCADKSPIKERNLELEKHDTQSHLEEKDTEDSKKDVLRLQIESLERVIAEQRKENVGLRERVKQHVDELQERDQTFKDLEVKLDLMSKKVEQASREKDAAVMRYASVECAAIEAKRAAERAAAAEKAACVEVELLNNKLKSAHTEKARICQLYDDKCHELSNCERELGKVREDVKELEGRLKWTQSKLRMEMDAYKESAERAERLAQQVSQLEATRDAAAACASDCARTKQIEIELKESQAALILCRHEKEELERRLASTTQQLDTYRRERDAASCALAHSTAEVERLKASNLQLEEEAAELAALRAQAALADTLSAQLQREMSRAAAAEEALSREQSRAETCARREAAALEHAASLTATHVLQRASSNDSHHKAEALAVDNASLRERVSALEEECTRLQRALDEESARRGRETRALARKVAELTEEAAEANKNLEWEKGENGVLKKKHGNAIKELNRELHRALKRCEQLEAKLPPPRDESTRTGSVSSLSSSESTATDERLQNGHTHTDSLPDIQVREPDRQELIERIVSLQRAAARRAERCEFLEEHSRQLTAELRGKSRLLRHLLCSLPAGAVASPHSDAHKKEIARLGGGAMAAVWGGSAGGMSLELSLEMNTRLQAVLEDALLKNITLKENLDTLGEEIARLKEQKATNNENNAK